MEHASLAAGTPRSESFWQASLIRSKASRCCQTRLGDRRCPSPLPLSPCRDPSVINILTGRGDVGLGSFFEIGTDRDLPSYLTPGKRQGCRSRKDQDSGRGEGERGCIVRGTREPRRRHSSVRNRSGKLLRFGRRFLDVVKRVLTIVVAPLPVSRSFRHQHPNGERGRCPGELFRDRHRPRSPELLYSRNRQASSIRSTTAWMFSSTS